MIHHQGLVLCITLFVGSFIGGCSTYRVPGGAADFHALGITSDEQAELTEDSIARELAKKPASSFPANLAAVRVQARGYRSYTTQGYDYGNYSVVTLREVESDTDIDSLASLPMINNIIPLNRLVIIDIKDESDIRKAAARVQADMVLIYTFDTKFGVESFIPALGVITLGLFPNDEARVTSTASAALIDTRTGFIYALAESTADAKQIANAWTSKDAVDQSRRRAERDAFEGLISELKKAWKQVVETYAISANDKE